MRLARDAPFCGFLAWDCPAVAVVAGRLGQLLGALLVAQRVEALLRAEAGIRGARRDETLGVLAVDREALAPSQCSDSKIIRSEVVLERSRSVSSMRRMNCPPFFLAQA